MNKSKIYARVAELEAERSKEVELSKESIELGAIQDLESKIAGWEDDKKSLLSMISQINQLKTKAKKGLEKHNATNKKLTKEASDLRKKFNDLGVDSKELFSLENKIATVHSRGFDGDVVNFLYK